MQESVIPKQQQYRLVLVDTCWYPVSMEWYWLVLGGTGSVEGSTFWYDPELFPHSACVKFFVTFKDQLADLSLPT